MPEILSIYVDMNSPTHFGYNIAETDDQDSARFDLETADLNDLDMLVHLLNSVDKFADNSEFDLESLPSFGGERPAGGDALSWDRDRVLVFRGDGYALIPRDA